MKKTLSELLRRLLSTTLILTIALFLVCAMGAETTFGKDSTSPTNGSGGTGTIRIGDTTFGPEENVSSHWSDGEGWKNLPGKYVAMVDYKGQGEEISKDGGILTLAVAGVNRIGVIKGNCSVNIVGTGIVLIDSIELEGGNTISLMTDASLYEDGSAAVFLKQSEESYLLINGGIPGILDEGYRLDDVELTIPGGSSLVLYATAYRTETWYPGGAEGSATDVTRFTTSLSDNDLMPDHGGEVEIEGSSAKLILGSNSSLTVEDGASIQLRTVTWRSGAGYIAAKSNLVVEGILNVNGTVEGGVVDVSDSGSLVGGAYGSVLSSTINLSAEGTLSQNLLLDDCAVTLAGKDEVRYVSATIMDSVIYLKGNEIFLENLNVSGDCMIGIEAVGPGVSYYSDPCGIGDITFSEGSSLSILANDHMRSDSPNTKLLEDCHLYISGQITGGGTVSVLAGCVRYTGTQTDTLPVVPYDYASRVLVDNLDADSSAYPLLMTQEEAAEQGKSAQIPVMKLDVIDSLSEETVAFDQVLAREWIVDFATDLEPLTREEGQYFIFDSLLQACNLQPSQDDEHPTLVEVIYSNFDRQLFSANGYDAFSYDTFSTEDVVMIRVIDCSTRGGQGGDSITHTETLFTGNGAIGNTGNGAVTYGTGTVVYTQQASFFPTDPDDHTDDEEEDAEEDEDDETDVKDDETDDDQGYSNEWYDGNDDNNDLPSEDIEFNGQSAQTDNALTTVVTALGNGRYTLDVYQNGTKLKSLNGSSVTVSVPNLENVTGSETCYAVFENGKSRKWIPARYDSTTGELIFEADQVGTFGIARALVEEVRFRAPNTEAPLYHKLSVLIGKDEVTDFSNTIAVEASLKTLKEGSESLYAVFVDEGEGLHVSPITYDQGKGTYRFETDVTGNFVVIAMAGPFQSDVDLHDACKAAEEFRILITLMRLQAFWS